jgi:hypothetical protein
VPQPGCRQIEAGLTIGKCARNARAPPDFSLTDEGELLFGRGMGIIAEIDELEAEVSAKVRTPKGCLRVSAPSEIGRRRIAPLVSEFTELYPATSIELILMMRSRTYLETNSIWHCRPIFPRMETSSPASFLRVAASYAPRRGISQSMMHRRFPKILRDTIVFA